MKFSFTRNGERGWFWTVTYEDGTKEDYKTDKYGSGLWRWDNSKSNYKQILGTCQFGISAKTDNGQKAYVRRWFSSIGPGMSGRAIRDVCAK